MGLFDLFFKPTTKTISVPIRSRKYDMDSLEGINSIPVPAQNYNTGDPTKDCIYYLLQRKATEHKKNGKMDLAIACLRKSNALSDYERRPLLTQKEYLRLIKFIESTGDFEKAQLELENIYKRHPEFLDKRVSNLLRVKDAIKKNKEFKNDYVLITTNKTCSICSKYNRKIYSISGKSKKYPKLPSEISHDGGTCPNCILGITSYFENISSPVD